MKYVSDEMLTAFKSGLFKPVVLFEMYVNGTYYRYCDYDVPITNKIGTGDVESSSAVDVKFKDGDIIWVSGDVAFPGKTSILWGIDAEIYLPRGITIDSISSVKGNMVNDAVVKIDNIDKYFNIDFIGYTPRGSDVTIKYVVLNNTTNYVIGYIDWFVGQINAWELNVDEDLQINIAGIFTRWSQKTLSPHPLSCRWKVYGGPECKYSGPFQTCDRSYKQCIARNNTANFGGFRWLADIVDKEIWWGRNRDVTERNKTGGRL